MRPLNGADNKTGEFHMKKFLKDDSGVTAIEYALIAAAMGAGLIAITPTLLTSVTAKFTTINGYYK